MKIHLPALYIIQELQSHGFEAYLVGGAVRDLLQSQNDQSFSFKQDYDFTTNATPEEIQKVFPDSFYENTFGTVSITLEDIAEKLKLNLPTEDKSINIEEPHRIIDFVKATKVHASLSLPEQTPQKNTPQFPNFEITTFRSDGAYEDHRRPTSVSWGETLKEDLDRRDFTINAQALKITGSIENLLKNQTSLLATIEVPSQDFEVIDYHQGQADLAQRIIRTVGDPNQRFEEDALRMLRAVRFAMQLEFSIEPQTKESIKKHAHLITHISAERIRDELMKIIASDFPADGILLLDELGLLTHILPELQEGKGINQGGHHTDDVWTHSIEALRTCPSQEPIVRLATLLHDIGKPRTYALKNGGITFYNHEMVGAKMAKQIAWHLKLSKKEMERLYLLVRYHMFHYQPENTDAAIRRFMRKVGLENLDDILDLREGDRLGSGARKTSWRLEEMKQRMIEQLHQPMEIKDLAIGGHDLMEEFQLKPGRILGEILNKLFEMVLDNPELNTKENLLKEAQKIIDLNRQSSG